jgi:hypothetical protein
MYNPYILGYVANKGPIVVPVQEAKETYGRFPSEHDLLPANRARRETKSLNVELGVFLTEWLAAKNHNLKWHVHEFFASWHRDFDFEFGVSIAPLLNLNDPNAVLDVIRQNDLLRRTLPISAMREMLTEGGIIRRDVVNSISSEIFFDKAFEILSKKLKLKPVVSPIFGEALDQLHTQKILYEIEHLLDVPIAEAGESLVATYADELALFLSRISKHTKLYGIERLKYIKGKGVEFEFATRDSAYLELGKEIGDCTADKNLFQTDRDVENIYWTVFAWIMDRNYQILKVYFDGHFTMKWHLVPLYLMTKNNGGYIYLAIDAIETTPIFRSQDPHSEQLHLLENREVIFDATIHAVEAIADRMGIEHIYAEKFSNTKWIRDKLADFPEMYLYIDQVIKIDELEDVFEAGRELVATNGSAVFNHVFAEIQAKNTFLIPELFRNDVKSFAVIRGSSDAGLPINKVFTV